MHDKDADQIVVENVDIFEAVVNEILDDLVEKCQPRYMEIIGEFSTRGGMNSTVKAVFDPEKRGSFK